MVPNTGKTDAEIVFAGVASMDLNSAATVPVNSTVPLLATSNEQLAQHQHPFAQPFQTHESVIPATSQAPIIELASAANEQTVSTNYQQQQQKQSVFGTVPPTTSIPSLNESFNIPPTLNPSMVPASVYQPQCNVSQLPIFILAIVSICFCF